MNAYKIKGTYHEHSAIGIPETFERIIFADTPREAYYENRSYHYQKGREHVLTMEIQESRIAKICGLGEVGTAFYTVDDVYYL